MVRFDFSLLSRLMAVTILLHFPGFRKVGLSSSQMAQWDRGPIDTMRCTRCWLANFAEHAVVGKLRILTESNSIVARVMMNGATY
jgi:hypothetical protein